MIEIIPAVMPDSFEDLESKIGMAAHYVPFIQIDIMDGKFVKTRSWPYFSNDEYSFQNLLTESDGMPYWDKVNFEMDLMIDKPENAIDDWIVAGASRLIVHVESTKKLDEIVKNMNERFSYPGMTEPRDVELGLALNIDTPTDTILPYLEDIQFVQFMGIARIGHQSEPFDDRVLDKIRDFHNAHPEVIISVDGGVDFETAPELIEIGVKRLVSGSAVFENGHVADAIAAFKKLG